MVPDLFFYQLVLFALVWLCLMLQRAWLSDRVAPNRHDLHPHHPGVSVAASRNPLRASPANRPAMLVRTPSGLRLQAPSAPPPRIIPKRAPPPSRPSTHFCPNPACAYRGWVGWGHLRANGHPNGGAGANCCASSVAAIFWRLSARSSTASVWYQS